MVTGEVLLAGRILGSFWSFGGIISGISMGVGVIVTTLLIPVVDVAAVSTGHETVLAKELVRSLK